MPSVSIIMTLYNRADYFTAAARSVLAQTHKDIQLIVADDGSTDGSLQLAHQLAQRDPRVTVLALPHRGVAPTLKHAHQHALAPLIGWVDSDDLLIDSAVEQTKALLDAHPSVGLVYTDHVEIDHAGTVLREGTRSKLPYSPHALLTDLISFQFRLFRREVFDAAGGIDDTFTTAPDYDFCLRASEVTQFARIPQPLYCYRQHDRSISAQRQYEQITSSQRAVQNALKRRGLADSLQLKVTLRARFELVPTPNLR